MFCSDKNIGVLMGGVSEERDISLKGGDSVCKALLKGGCNVTAIDAIDDICSKIMEAHIDVAFIVLHGRYGEDGCIQGLLEVMGIPYTGSGVLASAIAMNKVAAKKVLAFCGIKSPGFHILKSDAPFSIPEGLKAPLIIKPASQGSTIGITVVWNLDDLRAAVDYAFSYGDEILIEEYIQGREITASILNGTVLPIIEIKAKGGIYDYRAKYIDRNTEYVIPARLKKQVEDGVKRVAFSAYKAIGCRGAARIDMIIDDTDTINVLEVNTIPGMTEKSLLPMAAAAAGINYSMLVEEMLKSSIPHSM